MEFIWNLYGIYYRFSISFKIYKKNETGFTT